MSKREVEFFVFDIFIAILKADAFIEDNQYLDFVIKELEALKSTNEITNTIPRKVT